MYCAFVTTALVSDIIYMKEWRNRNRDATVCDLSLHQFLQPPASLTMAISIFIYFYSFSAHQLYIHRRFSSVFLKLWSMSCWPFFSFSRFLHIIIFTSATHHLYQILTAQMTTLDCSAENNKDKILVQLVKKK